MFEILLIAILAIIVGTNDAANVFGSAVGSKMLKFNFAIIFFFIFIIIGALINAKYPSGIYQNLFTSYPLFSEVFLVLVPVIFVTLISLKLKIPSSISQSIIFSLFGFALAKSFNFDNNLFLKLIYFWVATPIIAFILSIFFCYLIQFIINILKLNVFQIDYQIRLSLIFFGCIAAFALGSNLTASIVGIYSPYLNLDLTFFNSKILINENKLYFFGSFLIGLGALIFSQRIVQSVGSQISTIKPVSALAILLTQIIILLSFSSNFLIQKINTILPFEIFAMPLSASHITFAGIIGVASFNKFREVQPAHTMKIIISWFLIPSSVFIMSYLISLTF
jgi:PiT family inorganic phosphate transporter